MAETVFEDTFDISTDIIGHDPGRKELKVLNRFIFVTDEGYTYEPVVRHAEILINEHGVENANQVNAPASHVHNESDELLDHGRFKKYQCLCARLNFLAVGRADWQYAAKECCRAMSRPTMKDRAKLQQIGRYVNCRRSLCAGMTFKAIPQ
jgi:hypothetical protein